MCNHDGGTVDDLIAYKRADDNFLLCVNASNTVKDFEHLKEHAKGFDCELENQSSEFGQPQPFKVHSALKVFHFYWVMKYQKSVRWSFEN